ncbi:hypothetical protein KP509_20G081100 [Ceratopteris richardii]|uniref:Uncharacterized protein n=1 Tax=Ceratopteris richardii TaxID=49495 RepID=A0A8T2SGM6_CERRI|nr:hypothetical protein KP509_1Z263800 [Ceratopteris richardii]KAH6556186.1 hypothetical protein KP509_1Z198200 [Ceratopteris richardii]KAH7332306.1 hypothetical protein KP509_20G081100 [Ceratopteris richardii]
MARVQQNVTETAWSYLVRLQLLGIPINVLQLEGELGSSLLISHGKKLLHKIQLPADANVAGAKATWCSSNSTLGVEVPKSNAIKFRPELAYKPVVPMSQAVQVINPLRAPPPATITLSMPYYEDRSHILHMM